MASWAPPFLECVRKSVKRFSDKTHDKTKSESALLSPSKARSSMNIESTKTTQETPSKFKKVELVESLEKGWGYRLELSRVRRKCQRIAIAVLPDRRSLIHLVD